MSSKSRVQVSQIGNHPPSDEERGETELFQTPQGVRGRKGGRVGSGEGEPPRQGVPPGCGPEPSHPPETGCFALVPLGDPAGDYWGAESQLGAGDAPVRGNFSPPPRPLAKGTPLDADGLVGQGDSLLPPPRAEAPEVPWAEVPDGDIIEDRSYAGAPPRSRGAAPPAMVAEVGPLCLSLGLGMTKGQLDLIIPSGLMEQPNVTPMEEPLTQVSLVATTLTGSEMPGLPGDVTRMGEGLANLQLPDFSFLLQPFMLGIGESHSEVTTPVANEPILQHEENPNLGPFVTPSNNTLIRERGTPLSDQSEISGKRQAIEFFPPQLVQGDGNNHRESRTEPMYASGGGTPPPVYASSCEMDMEPEFQHNEVLERVQMLEEAMAECQANFQQNAILQHSLGASQALQNEYEEHLKNLVLDIVISEETRLQGSLSGMANNAGNDLRAQCETLRNEMMGLLQSVHGQVQVMQSGVAQCMIEQGTMQESRIEAKLLGILQQKFNELQATSPARLMAFGDGPEAQHLQNHVHTLERRVTELEEAKIASDKATELLSAQVQFAMKGFAEMARTIHALAPAMKGFQCQMVTQLDGATKDLKKSLEDHQVVCGQALEASFDQCRSNNEKVLKEMHALQTSVKSLQGDKNQLLQRVSKQQLDELQIGQAQTHLQQKISVIEQAIKEKETTPALPQYDLLVSKVKEAIERAPPGVNPVGPPRFTLAPVDEGSDDLTTSAMMYLPPHLSRGTHRVSQVGAEAASVSAIGLGGQPNSFQCILIWSQWKLQRGQKPPTSTLWIASGTTSKSTGKSIGTRSVKAKICLILRSCKPWSPVSLSG